MKKLLFIVVLLFSMNMTAQYKNEYRVYGSLIEEGTVILTVVTRHNDTIHTNKTPVIKDNWKRAGIEGRRKAYEAVREYRKKIRNKRKG